MGVIFPGPKGSNCFNNRINLGVRYSGTSALRESQRDIVPTTTSLFDPRGNITGIGGAQIDPALSALVGRPVTQVGVPASALMKSSLGS